MKKYYLIILPLVVILFGLIVLSARFYFVKEKVKSPASVIDETGYKIYSEQSKIFLVSPRDERLAASEKLQALIGQATTSSFIAPIDDTNSTEIYLSSYEITEGRSGGVGDPCVSRNRIYKYNLKNDGASIIYEEISRDGSPYEKSKCRILRTVGREGSKLMILIDDPDNSGGPCTNVWVDYTKQFEYLDLSKKSLILLPYVVPAEKIKEAREWQKQCLETLPVN